MSKKYRLTPRAYKDLKDIARYSLKVWGRRQRETYLADLHKRFEWLAANPHLGRKRDEIASGYNSFPQGSHVIFYIICNDGIDIIGIPHHAMDHTRFFNA
ncbi:MAG: type II toxin-antitoxin system RelE/ParE family toxin [Alphaproteobacteria bacterium]|jgi:toxin ParE1/3/4|nr:type II toxin-antitoxin system RelE/ParE family toxin [Alphaproteobacteria bacterium]